LLLFVIFSLGWEKARWQGHQPFDSGTRSLEKSECWPIGENKVLGEKHIDALGLGQNKQEKKNK
jgi:hypothetical protein